MQSYAEICQKICQSSHDKALPRGFFAKAATHCFHTVLNMSYFFFILELLPLKMNGAHAVPDLQPSLLDSNFVKPSKLQLLLHPSGKYVAYTSGWFNFLQLLQTPNLIFNQYHHISSHKLKKVTEISRSCLADTINDFVDILDALPQHTGVTHDKRFLGGAQLIGITSQLRWWSW